MSLHGSQNNKEILESHSSFTARFNDDLADFQDKAYDLGFEAGRQTVATVINWAREVSRITFEGLANGENYANSSIALRDALAALDLLEGRQ